MLVFVVVGFSATLHSEVEAASKKMKLSATSKKLEIKMEESAEDNG